MLIEDVRDVGEETVGILASELGIVDVLINSLAVFAFLIVDASNTAPWTNDELKQAVDYIVCLVSRIPAVSESKSRNGLLP